MTYAAIAALEPVDAPRRRIPWVELCCLNCGEVAGYIENGRLVKPVAPGRIRMQGRRLRCGRCAGLLLSGERGVASSTEAIG